MVMENKQLRGLLVEAIEVCNSTADMMELCRRAENVAGRLTILLEALGNGAGKKELVAARARARGLGDRNRWKVEGEVETAVRLRARGWTYDRIGKHMGRSHAAVQKWVVAELEARTNDG